MRPSVLLFYLVPIIAAAFLATLASASIGSLSGWGFPFQWKIGGCTTINGTLICAAEYDNWLFFAADTASFVLVGYAVTFVGYRLAPRIIERVAILGPRSVLFAALFGSAITLATGFLSSGQLASPGGFSGQNYGFPLVWKTSLASCPPPCIQANGTYYDWIFLVGDILFYTTACYFPTTEDPCRLTKSLGSLGTNGRCSLSGQLRLRRSIRDRKPLDRIRTTNDRPFQLPAEQSSDCMV